MMAIGQVLASCVLAASQTYDVPPAVLAGIMQVEGGAVGQAVRNTNGTYDLGPMQINTIWIPELSKIWQMQEDQALLLVRDDPCVNVHVAAWILKQKIVEADNLTLGIAHYHSKTKRFGYPYAKKVISAMRRMDLIEE